MLRLCTACPAAPSLQWLEFFLAYCGALAFEGDPIEWSKNHRWHHQNSDSPADRHSPRDGLWHAHMGWLFDESLTNTRCVWGGGDVLCACWMTLSKES
jgi:fatty-acid desaturase